MVKRQLQRLPTTKCSAWTSHYTCNLLARTMGKGIDGEEDTVVCLGLRVRGWNALRQIRLSSCRKPVSIIMWSTLFRPDFKDTVRKIQNAALCSDVLPAIDLHNLRRGLHVDPLPNPWSLWRVSCAAYIHRRALLPLWFHGITVSLACVQ